MAEFNHPPANQSQNSEPPLRIPAPPKKRSDRHAVFQFILWAAAFGVFVFGALVIGAFAGFQSGNNLYRATATVMAKSLLEDQFLLANQNISEGQYEMAYQRLEFVLTQDPAYPGAAEKMAEVMAILYATATPTPPPPTASPTATRDLRPVEEMFEHAQALLAEQKWSEALDTLVTLRKEDLEYQTARVDGMMFLSLRMRGFDKIWKSGDLNGGIYDLALAGRFGPLDAQSISARDLARLYLIGSSFWEVDPAQAVQYFSQVAAAAPGLRDASGIPASARYREALIQYGDQLAANRDWCNAQQQYQLAYSISPDDGLREKLQNAALECSPPTATPGPTTEVPTAAPPTETLPVGITPSPTSIIPPTATNTQPVNVPTDTPLPPTNTPELPTNTPEPPTNTPLPPTDTPEPPTETQPAAQQITQIPDMESPTGDAPQ